MLFYSWRGELDARIAAEAKIKADEEQVQVLQQNIAQNNQAIAQLQEQHNARDAAAAKQIATLTTLVTRHIYMTLNTDPENLSVAVVSEMRLLDLKLLEVGSGEGALRKRLVFTPLKPTTHLPVPWKTPKPPIPI